MRLYLVRHAQAESNVGVYTGKDSLLTKTGVEQSKRLGLYFKTRSVKYIYCSKMKRAIDTLKEMLPYLQGIPINYTNTIDERSKGIYEHNREAFKKAVLESGQKDEMFRPPKGENLADVEHRAQRFLDLLKDKHKKDTILVVGHGMFLRVLINRIFKFHIKEIQYYELHNAGVSSFVFDKNFKVQDFEISDYKHLIKYSSYPREIYEKPFFSTKSKIEGLR